DGIPFAMALASVMEIPMVYVRKRPPLSLGEYISRDVPKIEQRRIDTFYLQKREIRENSNVLIVDDIIRTGRTQKALIDMVKECGGKTTDILALIGDKNLEMSLKSNNGIDADIKVHLLYEF
ncbi:MAG: phosphoribosyltransferase family protein, partial [Candidatus Hodarchaeales archaeon]